MVGFVDKLQSDAVIPIKFSSHMSSPSFFMNHTLHGKPVRFDRFAMRRRALIVASLSLSAQWGDLLGGPA
jgi:hypothetical protein